MYDLTTFTMRDMTECGAALRKLGSGTASMEEAASRIVGYLYDHLIDQQTGAKACALVRFYKTHPYEGLDADLREFACGLLGEQPPSPALKCLTLLTTIGERPEWNSRADSAGHKAIPLPSEQVVTQLPMISQLVKIYLLDEVKERLIVAEGMGLAGAEMKATGHSIPLNAPVSLVARAARTGEIVKVDNVREAEDWLPNPLLPDTYSEMAVPISLEGQVVGVLDMQQDKIAGLDDDDANLFRSLANQVAVAIRNARQFASVEAALAEAYALQRQYLSQAWDRTRVTRKSVGRVQFSLGESTTLGEGIIASAQQQALSHQKPTVVALTGQSDGPATPHALVAPVMLGDVMIGDLQLHGIEPDRAWAESELALINAVIDQVAQTAENLRLLDETQERASREQLVSQISNKMRHAPDMESLMKVAVAELARVLNPARTFVRLDSEATLSATPPAIAGNGGSLQPEVNQT